MSFLLSCPNCGKRAVGEFAFRSEVLERPSQDDDFRKWAEYVYLRRNHRGKQLEWWYHRGGCQSWFLVERDTVNNTDHRSFWYTDLPKILAEGGGG